MTLTHYERVYMNPLDDWKCPCGNVSTADGFYPSDLTGREVEPTVEGPWNEWAFVCARCGRIIDSQTGLVVMYGTFIPKEES